jgi:septal ring factor EnvC (AmiA/AmiB activator)
VGEEFTLYQPLPKLGFLASLIAVACGISIPFGAWAEPRKALKDLEQSIDIAKTKSQALAKKAKENSTDLWELKQQSISIVAKARNHTFTLIKLEEQLAELDQRCRIKKQSLSQQKKHLVSLVTALQRIALTPPIALIALPAKPLDTIRSALLIRGTVPEIKSREKILREDIKALSNIQEAIKAAQQEIQTKQIDLDRERRSLAKLMTRKLKLIKKTNAAQEKSKRTALSLRGRAKNLRELFRRLTQNEKKKNDNQPLKPNLTDMKNPSRGLGILKSDSTDQKAPKKISSKARGPTFLRQNLPVVGRVTFGFDTKDLNGQRRRGLSIEAKPGAAVISPRSGKIVFAGPFRGLGNLIIIEYGLQHHLLLGGLGKIDVPLGEKVLAGEPVGIIPFSERNRTILYLELRRKGRPINPMPWLAAKRVRKRG